MSPVAVRDAGDGDRAAIAGLVAARADRLEALDGRLALPRTAAPGERALVAHDPDGRLVGHLRPALVELPADDEMRAFAPDRAVSWQDLAVTGPGPLRSLAAAASRAGAADVAMWPSVDAEAGTLFAAVGCEPAFVLALRAPGPLSHASPAPVRRARPGDTDALLALHLEEIAFHLPHTKYVRLVPALEPSFRARLARVWAGDDPIAGASLLHVVEVGGAVVGMCESMVATVPDDGVPRQIRPGRYGYLNSVGIQASLRGRDLGRALVARVLEDLSGYDVSGYTLWFASGNPIASKVWPRLGFRPLWTRYERR